MTGAPARVVAVEPDYLVVDAGGRRCCVAMDLPVVVRPGDWVLITQGAVVRRAAPPDAALDHPHDADLEDERHHYPTEDPESAGPLLHHPPTR